MHRVVITGVGLVTPLGADPAEVLRRLEEGERAASPPTGFDVRPFACPVCAEVGGFDPHEYISDRKAIRLMNRDALLAAAAARAAVRDARLQVGVEYRSEEIGLFGSTGLAGMGLHEVAPLIRYSAAPDGGFDAKRFGSEALKRIRPILSFKILSNMPICFVSIFERIQGPNAVYNPWEGQGAQAIGAGIRAIRRGAVPCALVGGCDVKTHELAFISLEQEGLFRSWREEGRGTVPGEGAAFLVLEDEGGAISRKAPIHARIANMGFATANGASPRAEVYRRVLSQLDPPPQAVLFSGEEGDLRVRAAEDQALAACGIDIVASLRPKLQVGNLFAAAAFVQVGLAARWATQDEGRAGECRGKGDVLADCFGHGSEQAAFLLERC